MVSTLIEKTIISNIIKKLNSFNHLKVEVNLFALFFSLKISLKNSILLFEGLNTLIEIIHNHNIVNLSKLETPIHVLLNLYFA